MILSSGPYAKGLEFKEGYPANWARLVKSAPEVLDGNGQSPTSSTKIISEVLTWPASAVLNARALQRHAPDGRTRGDRARTA